MEEVEQKRWRRNDINEDGRKVQRERENQRTKRAELSAFQYACCRNRKRDGR